MILGTQSSCGADYFLGTTIFIPQLDSFNQISFSNDTYSMIISQIYGQNMDMTTDYLNNYSFTIIPTWNENTYFLALFQNTIAAGNILGFNGDVINWILYRENADVQELEYINTLDVGVQTYNDYTALRNNTYRYYIFAKTIDQMSSALITNYSGSEYYGYFLIDVDDNVVYKIDSAVSDGNQTQNILYSEFEGNQQYKTYSVGTMNYMSGTVSGIVTAPILEDGIPNNSIGLLENLRTLIKDNTKTKLLKTRKGEVFKVFTYGYSENPLEQGIGQQPMVISFSWNEIGKVGY